MFKKILLIGFPLLLTACQSSQTSPQTVVPTPTNAATAHPPTVTPEPTVTAAPTATPVPLYFTDTFNHDLGAWTFFQTGGIQPGIFTISGDALQLQMTSPHTWQYALHTAHEYESVFIKAKVSASPSGSVGLVCGYTEENGWYEFNISHEGVYTFLHATWLAEGIADYRPILQAATEYLRVGKVDDEIGLACQNNTAFFYINEKLFRKIDISHIGMTAGKAGISAASFDNVPANINIEWFETHPLE